MNPLVSIILPVYADQFNLDLCLRALSQQSLPAHEYEVIVVDNLSDPPISLKSEFSEFARLVVCSQPGSYIARNTGIREARGHILGFTDADCIPEPEWIRSGARALTADNENAIVGGEVIVITSKNPTAVETYQHLVGFQQRENIETRGFSATANLFATSDHFGRTGLFNEALLSGGDREWCWRASNAGFRIRYAPDVIVRTIPRSSLPSAIRQARRVTGGRFVLERSASGYAGVRGGILPHRTSLHSMLWLLQHPAMTHSMRLKVCSVAFLLRVARALENLRLRAGGKPIR